MATPVFLFPIYSALRKKNGKKDGHHKKVHPFPSPQHNEERRKKFWEKLLSD